MLNRKEKMRCGFVCGWVSVWVDRIESTEINVFIGDFMIRKFLS